jgi:hypothetical protein
MLSKVKSQKSKVKSQKSKVESKGKVIVKAIFLVSSFFYSLSTSAQCAMCRASLESEGNVAKNEALNDGIVYLMAIPYILVAAIGFVVYRMFAKKKSNES